MTTRTKFFFCLVVFCLLSSGKDIELRESDFTHGTYIIDQPGHYKLMEDVTFNPNSVKALGVSPYEAGDVLMSQYTYFGGKYDPAAFGVGFFAAIAISADDVVLDLNGKKMIQSKEHALQQRFYAHIELANQPFLPTQGPHDFGTQLTGAKNVVIKNGIFGRTSHHAIHGNSNFNITIQDLHIYDYEVAGIALNGVRGLTVKNVHMSRCRYDIPVLGLFSAGRFIRPYINWLVSQNSTTTIRVQGQTLTASDLQEELKRTLNNVYEDVITRDLGYIDKERHPVEYALFHNRRGVVDGNSYGLLLNRPGVAVNGFPYIPTDPASFVLIDNVIVENHASDTHEIPSLRALDGKELVDPVGSVWQIFNLHPDTKEPLTISSYDLNGKYRGNIVSNIQALVGRAVMNGEFLNSRLGTRRTKFNDRILSWVENPETPLSDYTNDYSVVCNGDTMFHVSKGVIAFKLDAAASVSVSNVRLSNITNYGPKGIDHLCPYSKTTMGSYQATTPGYEGADCRGFSFSGSVNITVKDSEIIGLTSYGGSAYGFDVITDSHDITIEDCKVDKIRAGVGYSSVAEYKEGPTRIPEAYGFHSGSNSSYVHLHDGDCDHFSAIGPSGDILFLGKNNEVVDDSGNSDNTVSKSSSSVLSASIGVLLLCVLLL